MDPYVDFTGRVTGFAVVNIAELMRDYEWRLSGNNVWKVERVLLDYPHRPLASSDARVDALRFHGITYLADRTRDVVFPGGKFNLPDVNARIGVAQVAQLPSFLARRRALVGRYFERFATHPPCVLPPQPRDGDGQTWNMFSVLLPLAGS